MAIQAGPYEGLSLLMQLLDEAGVDGLRRNTQVRTVGKTEAGVNIYQYSVEHHFVQSNLTGVVVLSPEASIPYFLVVQGDNSYAPTPALRAFAEIVARTFNEELEKFRELGESALKSGRVDRPTYSDINSQIKATQDKSVEVAPSPIPATAGAPSWLDGFFGG